MTSHPRTRILVVVFDALRPEFLTSALMPNLYRFATAGVWYRNSHAAFFTETRVNQSVVTTGCMPQKHGIVANKFYAPDVSPGLVLNTGDDAALEAAFKTVDGRLLHMPTLGERLAASGVSYASLSAGTPGGGRLINSTAEKYNTFRFAMRRPEAASPPDAYARLSDAIGPMPEYKRPAKRWITWAADAYLDYIEREITPNVMLLWLCEPDETFHYHGIGSPQSLETITHADAEFGRILERHADALAAGDMHIVAMSDHGQITLAGEALDLVARLNEAGFKASLAPGDDIELVVVPGNSASLWQIGGDDTLIGRCVTWLRSQDWCGPLFTKDGVAGTLTHSEVRLQHPRAADIALVFRADDERNAFNRQGSTLHDAPYPIGGGCHGGLSRYELHNVLTLGGARIRERTALDVPAGNVDITPTLLDLLGLDIPDGLDGRPLREAFRDGANPNDITWHDDIIVSENATGPKTYLSVSDLGHTRYLNRAWVG